MVGIFAVLLLRFSRVVACAVAVAVVVDGVVIIGTVGILQLLLFTVAILQLS